ncbi:MAG: glycosyltransferase family 4 protein [Methanospirillum sp.]|nr:glycosyltransferase family 4 protein [Methanospirillum sp.]
MRILVISVSDLGRDPRVNRQIRHLGRKHEVTCIGLEDPGVPGVAFHRIPGNPAWSTAFNGLLLLLRRYRLLSTTSPSLQRLRSEFRGRRFDLIIANDTDTLSFASAVRNGARLVFDAHEYAPREFEHSLSWRLLFQGYQRHLYRRYLGGCDRVLTVSDGIAEEIGREFGVRPTVMTNASEYRALAPGPVDPDHIRLVHHGGVNPQRRLERMIEMMDHLDERFSLDLMLVSSPRHAAYFDRLRALAAGRPDVRIVPPVPMGEIASAINAYDIGLYILEPSTFNERHALPNKLFEFVQARLAIAIGPSVEMARVVREHDLGVVAETFSPEAMADRIGGLTVEEIEHYKRQSHRAASVLSSEKNLEILDGILEDLDRHAPRPA